MNDLSPLEQALIRCTREAHRRYEAGDHDGAKDLMHSHGVQLLTMCVQFGADVPVYEIVDGEALPVGHGADA